MTVDTLPMFYILINASRQPPPFLKGTANLWIFASKYFLDQAFVDRHFLIRFFCRVHTNAYARQLDIANAVPGKKCQDYGYGKRGASYSSSKWIKSLKFISSNQVRLLSPPCTSIEMCSIAVADFRLDLLS